MPTQPEFPVNIELWAEINNSDADMHRPATIYQALMQAAPGDEPEESIAELQPFREAVADCLDMLSPMHRFVVEAIQSERVSFDELASRMNVVKGTAHYRYRAALAELRHHMISNPIIRKRISMEATWNTAARDAVNVLVEEAAWHTTDRSHQIIVDAIGYAKAELDSPYDEKDEDITNHLLVAGAGALNWLKSIDKWDVDTEVNLLASKQHDYGHENILAFGLTGLVVRVSDKVARLENLLGRGYEPANESIEDTLVDIVGYAAIAQMLDAHTFMFELEAA